ncbi:MAG TPA: DUF4157 domain-containing protein [Thermoanaerobaculia bacterium]|nr:DUF4157 domain-containing protein [Thermoanaerobaculia bacterium]
MQRAPVQAPSPSSDVPRFATERSRAPLSVEQGVAEARGGGQPLAAPAQAALAPTFGTAPLTRVRVHADSHADRLAADVQARAFTVGRDVFFRSGEYRPESSGGVELLAHEMTHVVQQGTGQVPAAGVAQACSACGSSKEDPEHRTAETSSPSSGLALGPRDDRFEREAHQVAQAVGSGQPSPVLQRRRETVLQRFCEDDPDVGKSPKTSPDKSLNTKRKGKDQLEEEQQHEIPKQPKKVKL